MPTAGAIRAAEAIVAILWSAEQWAHHKEEEIPPLINSLATAIDKETGVAKLLQLCKHALPYVGVYAEGSGPRQHSAELWVEQAHDAIADATA